MTSPEYTPRHSRPSNHMIDRVIELAAPYVKRATALSIDFLTLGQRTDTPPQLPQAQPDDKFEEASRTQERYLTMSPKDFAEEAARHKAKADDEYRTAGTPLPKEYRNLNPTDYPSYAQRMAEFSLKQAEAARKSKNIKAQPAASAERPSLLRRLGSTTASGHQAPVKKPWS